MALNLHFHHRQCLHPTGYVMFKCFLCWLVASTCHLCSPVTKAFDENLQNNSYIYISISILIHLFIYLYLFISICIHIQYYIYTYKCSDKFIDPATTCRCGGLASEVS